MKKLIIQFIILGVLMVFGWYQSSAQFASFGPYCSTSTNKVGKNSILWDEGDQFNNVNFGVSIFGIGDGKYANGCTDLLGAFSLMTQSPDKSLRDARSVTIFNYELVPRIAQISESLAIGLGGMLTWRKEGMTFTEISNNFYEVKRGGWSRNRDYGDPTAGSGEYFYRHRMGLGPQMHLIYDIDETFYLRAGYTISKYGKKGSFQSLELSTHLALDEAVYLSLSYRIYAKKFENPKDYTEGNSPSTSADLVYLPEYFKVNTSQWTFGIFFNVGD